MAGEEMKLPVDARFEISNFRRLKRFRLVVLLSGLSLLLIFGSLISTFFRFDERVVSFLSKLGFGALGASLFLFSSFLFLHNRAFRRFGGEVFVSPSRFRIDYSPSYRAAQANLLFNALVGISIFAIVALS